MSEEDAHFTFYEVISTMIFLACVWIAGKLCESIKMPGLIGEIVAGSLLGPSLANFAPEHRALEMIGEIGLILLVVEAGLEVDLSVLQQIGTRGLVIGIIGSFVPLGIGFGIASSFGLSSTSALAVGACFAPTSMGVALVVLKSGNALNTTMGQLVVAAAVADDVLALVILSELKALLHHNPLDFVWPVVSALGFATTISYLAIFVIPQFLQDYVVKYIPPKYVEDTLLGIMSLVVIALMCALNYGYGSYLLGAFLGGLSFCTAKSMMDTWHHQVKRIMKWLLRLFFSATVGFQVPIDAFWTPKVLGMGFALFAAVSGKMLMGFFATPLTLSNFLMVAFSMSTWGEFAFIIAVEAKLEGLIHGHEYAAVILAVLLSIIISPYCLRLSLQYSAKHQQDLVDQYIEDEKNHPAHVYYKLFIRMHNVWGLQPEVMRLLHSLSLDCIELRADSAVDNFVMYEAYLKDLSLQDDDPSSMEAEGLPERIAALRAALLALLTRKDANVKDFGENVEDFEDMHGFALLRWMPGNSQEEWIEFGKDETKARQKMAQEGFRPKSSTNLLANNSSSNLHAQESLFSKNRVVKGYTRYSLHRRHSFGAGEISQLAAQMDTATAVESGRGSTLGSEAHDDLEGGIALRAVGTAETHKYEEVADGGGGGVISAKRT
jgi:Kef-type K+ transport system membrane component KefB